MKQTAVEWLASQLGEHIIWEEKIIDLVEQAKEMEKEQIVNAYNDFFLFSNFDKNFWNFLKTVDPNNIKA